MTEPPFHSSNMRYAYQLRYHLGFGTRRAVPVFRDAARIAELEAAIAEVCQRCEFHILELDIQPTTCRLLVSLRPAQAPAWVVQVLKANTGRLLFAKMPQLETEIGRRSLWARGYFLRGVGDVTNEVVRDYIARQREHHEIVRRDSVLLAEYHHPDPGRYFTLRSFSHCVAEYNCHLVCCPVGHVPAIESEFAEPLIGYILRIAEARRFDVISVAVLQDHLHMLAALNPKNSPEWLALTVMNNTSNWFRRNNPGAFKVWQIPGFWNCSAFVGTAGAATTNQVRNSLQSRQSTVDRHA